MEIIFLGVGEACDSAQPNTSILIKTNDEESAGRILFDCGFSVPHQYLSLNPPPDELDCLWISHFHGDHFLGTPLLLLWFWEMNRTRPLNIIGPPGIKEKITQAMELSYPTLLARLDYSLQFHESGPDISLDLAGCNWNTAYNEHSQPCLSLRLEVNDRAVFYSGDGRPTQATLSLAKQCDIIIHEAYGVEDTVPGHGSISACADFTRQAGVSRLALVHIQRDIRPQSKYVIEDLRNKFTELEILLPEKDSRLLL